MSEQTQSAGKRLFKLVNDEVIFGEVEVLPTENGSEILIKKPFTAKNGNMMPYMVDVMTSAPSAIQIHPMNVLWSVPLDEFKEAEKLYIEATTGLVTETESQIIT